MTGSPCYNCEFAEFDGDEEFHCLEPNMILKIKVAKKKCKYQTKLSYDPSPDVPSMSDMYDQYMGDKVCPNCGVGNLDACHGFNKEIHFRCWECNHSWQEDNSSEELQKVEGS